MINTDHVTGYLREEGGSDTHSSGGRFSLSVILDVQIGFSTLPPTPFFCGHLLNISEKMDGVKVLQL